MRPWKQKLKARNEDKKPKKKKPKALAEILAKNPSKQ
jgi:hypothetical protein